MIPMPLSDAGRNAMLSGGLGNVITHISLHSSDPSTTGTGELTGGSPAYSRKAVTWNAPAAGVRDNATQMDFDVPAGTTVSYFGLWTAITAGSFLGWFPVGGFAAFAAVQPASTDFWTSYAHGLNNDDRVLVYDVAQVGLPAALTEGTIYWVVNKTTDTFQLSATQGGAAINAATDTEAVLQRVLPEVYAAQGIYTAAISALKLNAQFV
jgi:hypothetical protein